MKIRHTLKCFGKSAEQLNLIIKNLKYDDCTTIEERFLDAKILVEDRDDAFEILSAIADALKGYIYAGLDITLAAAIYNELKSKGQLLSTAESITGGIIADSFIQLPGASSVFYEGIVAYSNSSKVKRLHVPSDVLESNGAVSENVARAMAFGLLSSNKEIDFVIATTGFADVGCADAEAGLAYIAIGTRNNKNIATQKLNLSGERNQIRQLCANYAMFALIKLLNINNYEVE